MELYDQYINLVDKYSTNLTREQVVEKYNSLNNGKVVINDLIYATISKLTKENETKENISIITFQKLQRNIIFSYVINETDPIKYYDIINVIKDSTRSNNSLPKFENIPYWSEVIKEASSYMIINPSTFRLDLTDIRMTCAKEYDLAICAKYLIEKGCKIALINSEYIFETGLDEYIEDIEKLIQKIGGLMTAYCIFTFLRDTKVYSEKLERYLITRRPSQLANNSEPLIPFGYLLSLAVKYPFIGDANSKDLDKIFKDIIEKITNLAFIGDLQPYNIFENLFIDKETVIVFISSIALFDSVYSFPQMNPIYTRYILQGICESIDKKTFIKTFGFSLNQFIKVFDETIFKNKKHGPIKLNISDYEKRANISKKNLNKILSLLSHDKDLVNREFRYLADQEKNNFWFKPLIQISSKQYLLFDRLWCSPAFIEAFLTILRESFDKNIDSKIGVYLEKFIKKALLCHGIKYCSGNYSIPKSNGETDTIVETSKSIIIIEIKKKSLTRKARSGMDMNIIIDLMESLIESQLQANKVEIILREKGKIILKKGHVTHEIELNNRKIERISLSLFDYGGFQDRNIINQIMKAFTNSKLETDDEKNLNKHKEINDNLSQLSKDYSTLSGLDNSSKRAPYFNSWFISVPQLFMLLEGVKNEDQFYDNLLKVKYLSTGTCDLYFEYLHFSKMKSIQKNNS